MRVIEIVGRPTWWILGLLITPVSFVFAIILSIDLAKSFGKDTGYGILLVLFGFILLPIMAFSGDVQYKGPSAAQTTT